MPLLDDVGYRPGAADYSDRGPFKVRAGKYVKGSPKLPKEVRQFPPPKPRVSPNKPTVVKPGKGRTFPVPGTTPEFRFRFNEWQYAQDGLRAVQRLRDLTLQTARPLQGGSTPASWLAYRGPAAYDPTGAGWVLSGNSFNGLPGNGEMLVLNLSWHTGDFEGLYTSGAPVPVLFPGSLYSYQYWSPAAGSSPHPYTGGDPALAGYYWQAVGDAWLWPDNGLPWQSPWVSPLVWTQTGTDVGTVTETDHGTQTETDPELESPTDTPTVVITEDGTTVRPQPPTTVRKPPPPKTKELKGRVAKGLMMLIHAFETATEYDDVISAIYKALPDGSKCKTYAEMLLKGTRTYHPEHIVKKGKRKGQSGAYLYDRPDKAGAMIIKSKAVYHCADQLDLGQAIFNVVWSQMVEDFVWAMMGLRSLTLGGRGSNNIKKTPSPLTRPYGSNLGFNSGEFYKDPANNVGAWLNAAEAHAQAAVERFMAVNRVDWHSTGPEMVASVNGTDWSAENLVKAISNTVPQSYQALKAARPPGAEFNPYWDFADLTK